MSSGKLKTENSKNNKRRTKKDKFKISCLQYKENYSHIRITLDTEQDYNLILTIQDYFKDKEFLSLNDLDEPIFSSFSVEKVKARKGNKISSLRFYFEEYQGITIPMLEGYGEY